MAVVRGVEVHSATDRASVAQVAQLFQEYSEAVGFSLEFQDFDRERRNLPGEYSPPRGLLLLATVDGDLAGCAGLRPLDPATCEMKRLFVRPGYRGLGVGRKMADELITGARSRGYRRMRLDTVPAMTTAQALYRSLGFVEIPAYRLNPIPGAAYFEFAW